MTFWGHVKFVEIFKSDTRPTVRIYLFLLLSVWKKLDILLNHVSLSLSPSCRASLTTCTAAGRAWSTVSREPPTWWSLVKSLSWQVTVTWVKAASRLCVASELASSSRRSTPSTPCRPPWRVGDGSQKSYSHNKGCFWWFSIFFLWFFNQHYL